MSALKSIETMDRVEDRIALMKVYRDEWMHRDNGFASFFWKFIYLSLIITFLPNVLEAINTRPDMVTDLPSWIFPVAGVICAVFGIYLGYAENQRIKAIDEAYKGILETLPDEVRVKKFQAPLLKPRLNLVLCSVSYGTVIVLALANLFTILW